MSDDFMKWALGRAKEVTAEVGGSAEMVTKRETAIPLGDDQLFERPGAEIDEPPARPSAWSAVDAQRPAAEERRAPAVEEAEVLSEAARRADPADRVRVVDDGSNPSAEEFRWPDG